MTAPCAWSPCCAQETAGGTPFCYFHLKRASGLVSGLVYSQGSVLGQQLVPPSEEAVELIEQLYVREDEYEDD